MKSRTKPTGGSENWIMTGETENWIRCRIDGTLSGARWHARELTVFRATVKEISILMGWNLAGPAAKTIQAALGYLAQGQPVRLTSRHGWVEFQPLEFRELGDEIPVSTQRRTVTLKGKRFSQRAELV